MLWATPVSAPTPPFSLPSECPTAHLAQENRRYEINLMEIAESGELFPQNSQIGPHHPLSVPKMGCHLEVIE